MGMLLEALAKTQAAARDDAISQTIMSYAAQGMWPFQTGRCRMGLEYNIDTMNRFLWLELEAAPEHIFEIGIDERELYRDSSPESFLLAMIREPLINHYRNRPRVEPEDHIVLGED